MIENPSHNGLIDMYILFNSHVMLSLTYLKKKEKEKLNTKMLSIIFTILQLKNIN